MAGRVCPYLSSQVSLVGDGETVEAGDDVANFESGIRCCSPLGNANDARAYYCGGSLGRIVGDVSDRCSEETVSGGAGFEDLVRNSAGEVGWDCKADADAALVASG